MPGIGPGEGSGWTRSPSSSRCRRNCTATRILLRRYRRTDAEALWDAVQESREHLASWLQWVQGYRSIDDARAYGARAHARWVLREDMAYGILAREDGRLLGGTGLHDIDGSLRTFEIGHWIRRPTN